MNQTQYIKEAEKKYGICCMGITIAIIANRFLNIPFLVIPYIFYDISVLAFRIGRLHLIYSNNKQIDIKVSEVE